MAHSYCEHFVSAGYFVNRSIDLIKFCICIDLNQIWVGMFTYQILHINNRVTILAYHYNFVSAQHLENELMELNQILHMH